ncbi:MAG: putative hydrolase of the superfamily [Actinomycetota bacterium]|nr:putative hydrolase of the superfamily [Actinomycetota bacterium]
MFDYGEVISTAPAQQDRDELLAIAGVASEVLWASYEAHRDRLDHGLLSVTEYWRRVAVDVGAEWSLTDIQRLWTADFRGWTSVEPATVDLLDELVQGGTRIALLSNAGFDFVSPLTFSPIGALFERVFVSAELGLLKPDPAIYLRVASELGITPAEMVFVDNKSVNTDAAAALGITTHHFVGVAGLRGFLESLASGS